MASVEVKDENAGGTHSDSLKHNSEENLSKLKSNSENFTSKAEEYLKSDDVRFRNDLKLKQERKKLEDLLNAYKKLINKLDDKIQSEERKRCEEIRLSELPEIYALLQPQLYKNPGEDEKARLIQRSSSRRHYTAAEKIVPHTCRKPVITLYDKRQKLINKLKNKFQSEEEKRREEMRLSELPEMYALLQPDLYKNPGEDEKARLIQRSSSRRHYTAREKTVPPTCRTPVITLYDKRQKLINKLKNNFQSEEEKRREEMRLSELPEIYALLQPDLYKNPGEDEKARLIQRSSSRRHYTAAEKIVPPTCRKPVITLYDKRQEEKERFIKIISSAPARLLNTVNSTLPPRNLRRPKYVSLSPYVINEREPEKERLSKILVTSGIYYKKHLDQKRNPPNHKIHLPENRIDSRFTPINKLTDGKVYRGISTNDLEEVEELDGMVETINCTTSRQRWHSISTQTNPLDICQENYTSHSFHEKDQSLNKKEDNDIHSPRSCNNQEHVYYPIPQEKLMTDLHENSHCFPGVSSKISQRGDYLQDLKIRQAAYGKALQVQIEEKRKMEEERKIKEEEEEELIDQRIQLQQEKLKHEFNDDQKKKENWLAQRLSHEEVRRRRRKLEMELEAQELKKIERRRRNSNNASLPWREPALPKAYKPVVKNEEAGGTHSDSLKNNSEEDPSKLKSNSDNFTSKAKEYLTSDDMRFCNDLKLKRERKELDDLLNAYKKLINKLDNKFQSQEEKK